MPAAGHQRRKPTLSYCALALLFVVSATYRIRDTSDRIDEMRHGREIARNPFLDLDLPAFVMSNLQPEAQDAGLHDGDVVVALGARRLGGAADLMATVRAKRAGQVLTLTVRSASPDGTVEKPVTVTLQPMRPGAPAAVDWANFVVVSLALPYVCMALGFWVAAVRIRDRQAWLLLALLLSLAEFSGGPSRTLLGLDDAFQPVAVIYQGVLANLWPATMMLFGIYFPARLDLDRRRPWAKWIVLGPVLFRVLGQHPVLDVLMLHHAAAAMKVDAYLPTRGPVAVLQLIAMLVFFAAMAYKTVTASDADARRRLLLLDAGAALGVTPIVVAIVLSVTEILQPSIWILSPLLALLFVFPLTMAYVIVVDRAMDVRVAVRQGLQYLLARGTLRVIQLALLTTIGVLAMRMSAAASDATLASRIVLVSAGLAAVVVIQKFADHLRLAIDRQFFREAYNAEQILSELANQVRTMVETGPLVETVVHRISETLHVPHVALLLRGGGRMQPAYALGYHGSPDVALPDDSQTAGLLRQGSHARIVPGDRDSWIHDLPAQERHALTQLRSELLLPLSLNQKLVGVISLGAKQSEEPFSSTDLRLLESVAAQTGLALENSRLTAEIATEIANREKARRELEIAREVQERLFPQEYPPVPGLQYAGACRPALGVGGDYYDFIPLPDVAEASSPGATRRLGIAVGDVSGKGIPAALLMATLRAYLRGQTIQHESCLARMIANLNRLVYESSATNRYATFFYGQYDSATRMLEYVNAGHNPPMIFRAGGCDVVRLDTGGPVIGLMPDCSYVQGTVTLESGDVLVAFTDGISEAMNRADEDWGEERLAETVGRCRALPPRDLIARIMRSADEFAAGAPQHDDMTVVVLRSEDLRI